MRAALYARVSSDKQRENQTIASQLATLPRFVEDRGWKLAGQYVDDGRTAKAGHLEQREAFQRLLRDAEAGVFDVVCVVDLDRLTRSEDLSERGQVLGAFQKARVSIAVASTGQVLDLSSSMGDLMSTLGAFFAAEENRKRRERCARGRKQGLLKGHPMGWVPWGYRFDWEAEQWNEHSTTGPIVREIFARVAAGESTISIAEDLERRGVKRARAGGWTRERVYAIVHSTTYRGDWLADRKHNITIRVPRLVDDETWYAAQEQTMNAARRGLRRTRHFYLIEGLAICALCKSPIHIHRAHAGHAYYVCSRRKQLERKCREGACSLPFRRVAEIDGRVWKAIAKALEKPDLLADAIASSHDAETADAWTGDLRQFEARLERLAKAESVILDRYRRGLVSERAMDAELERNSRERRMLERQVEAAREQAAAPVQPVDELRLTLEGMRKRLDELTPDERRALVLLAVPVGGIELGTESIEITALTVPQPGVGYGGVSAYPNAPVANTISLRILA